VPIEALSKNRDEGASNGTLPERKNLARTNRVDLARDNELNPKLKPTRVCAPSHRVNFVCSAAYAANPLLQLPRCYFRGLQICVAFIQDLLSRRGQIVSRVNSCEEFRRRLAFLHDSNR